MIQLGKVCRPCTQNRIGVGNNLDRNGACPMRREVAAILAFMLSISKTAASRGRDRRPGNERLTASEAPCVPLSDADPVEFPRDQNAMPRFPLARSHQSLIMEPNTSRGLFCQTGAVCHTAPPMCGRYRINGDRVELKLLQWSPDSQRLAGEIGISPDERDWDRDLVEITVVPLRFRYIATIRNSSLVWTDKQFRWGNGELQVAASSSPERNIIVKSPAEIAWKPNPPSTPPSPPAHEHECSAMGTSGQ
jgi:hypothetical protein